MPVRRPPARLFPMLPIALLAAGCASGSSVEHGQSVATPATLTEQCESVIGAPRIVEIGDRILAAVGYDLANTILIRTGEGNVVVDPGMSPDRARPVREALLARAPGPVRALIYTHSHIDHVGGASVWLEEGTEIWATEAFGPHFLKQYGEFMGAEVRRGARQFGEHVPDALLPCSALGRRIDLDAARETGARLPTHTFHGEKTLDIGGVRIELVEAHGETHDQLFLWLPDESALLPGDNLYRAFPNLYTIRGTAPRPVDDWIESLDAMRARDPEHLVPSHTPPLSGRAAVRDALRDYRDAIQWVRDETVRGANALEPVERLAERVRLPAHLAGSPYLTELYGQIDWSVRAIYDNHLGWFDGRAETLYPLPVSERAAREVELMGGAAAVVAEARAALDRGDARWAIHLLEKLSASALPGSEDDALRRDLARAYRVLAAGVYNTNGRAYLLETAHVLEHGASDPEPPVPADAVLAGIPLEHFFRIMPTRLRPEVAGDVHESLRVLFPDEERSFTITIRHGVAEVVEGAPLPGTPEPVATLTLDALTWKRLAVQADSPVSAVAAGRLDIDGDALAAASFTRRFRQGL